MSVLIKGFKVPTGDEPRVFLTHFNDDGTAEMVAVGYPQKMYSLVEVPPHGRLIDADKLHKAMCHRAFETDDDIMWQSGCWVRYRAIEQVQDSQPTIIEAEDSL